MFLAAPIALSRSAPGPPDAQRPAAPAPTPAPPPPSDGTDTSRPARPTATASASPARSTGQGDGVWRGQGRELAGAGRIPHGLGRDRQGERLAPGRLRPLQDRQLRHSGGTVQDAVHDGVHPLAGGRRDGRPLDRGGFSRAQARHRSHGRLRHRRGRHSHPRHVQRQRARTSRPTRTRGSALAVGRAAVRPVAYLTVGANVAAYQSDSTRYGIDATLEYMGAAFRGEYGQRRDGGGLDDKGWYGQATYRVLPWVQLVLKQETSAARRSATRSATGPRPAASTWNSAAARCAC